MDSKFLTDAYDWMAEWHCVFWVSHALTVKPPPLLALLAQALCWMSQERPRAAFTFKKESLPATRKPRPPLVTAGAVAPPTKNIQSAERDVVKDHLQSYLRAVVKVWRFPPVAPVAAAVVVAAVLVVITYEKIILTFVL